jgi:hypothetical protein
VRIDRHRVPTTGKARYSAEIASCMGALLLLNTVGCGGGGGNPVAPTPVSLAVTAVTPNTGSPVGATAVTVTGTAFASGATVTFGGTAATGVTVVGANTITAITAARAAGVVDVVVTMPGGASATLPNGFTYAPLSIAGNWSGTTSQGRLLAFTVSGSAMTSNSITYQLTECQPILITSGAAVPITNDSFSLTASIIRNGQAVGTATINGTFSSNTIASGTITVIEIPPSTCPGSLSASWAALKN